MYQHKNVFELLFFSKIEECFLYSTFLELLWNAGTLRSKKVVLKGATIIYCNSLAKKKLIPKLYFLALTDSIPYTICFLTWDFLFLKKKGQKLEKVGITSSR